MGLFSRRNSQDTDIAALATARARLSSADVDQVRFLITNKKTVHAVKLIRDCTGLDLKHAKSLVDDIRLGRRLPATTSAPIVHLPGTDLAKRTRALKAAGQLRQAIGLVVSETGMTEVEAALFVGALLTNEPD